MRAPTPLGSAIQHALPSLLRLVLLSCLLEQVREQEEVEGVKMTMGAREEESKGEEEKERERPPRISSPSLRPRDA